MSGGHAVLAGGMTVYVLFAADVTWTSDGGGKAKAARKIVCGADRVSRFVLGVWRRYLTRVTERIVTVNGEKGLLMLFDGQPVSVISIESDGQRILAVYSVLNPDKLAAVASTPLRGD